MSVSPVPPAFLLAKPATLCEHPKLPAPLIRGPSPLTASGSDPAPLQSAWLSSVCTLNNLRTAQPLWFSPGGFGAVCGSPAGSTGKPPKSVLLECESCESPRGLGKARMLRQRSLVGLGGLRL